MIILDMINKVGTRIDKKQFHLENNILKLEFDCGTYDLTGKTITAIFNPSGIETEPLQVVEGIIKLPIFAKYVGYGINYIQLNFRWGTSNREQGPEVMWKIDRSLEANEVGQEQVDIITYLIAQYNGIKADYEAAEQARDDSYIQAETGRNNQYNTAEGERDTAYETAEGVRNQQAVTAEQNRNTEYTQAESNRDTLYNQAEDNRDTLYQQAEQNRDARVATVEEQINTLDDNKANRLGNDIVKIKSQYISLISVFLNGSYNNGTKIKTKIPYTAPSNNAFIITIKGTFGEQNCLIILQVYKPASGLLVRFCKASSINSFKPEIKLANEGGYLVIGFTDTTWSYHTFSMDIFTPDVFPAEYIEGWSVANESITGTAPVTVAYV